MLAWLQDVIRDELGPPSGSGGSARPDADAALAPGAAWTWSDGARRRALDHLAVRAVGPVTVVNATVIDGADVATASDHRPVVADLWIE